MAESEGRKENEWLNEKRMVKQWGNKWMGGE